ncbi:MAG: anaerobic ribonucleoside-triphosphate reductase activating protein [Clostridia bacterium]|nr:anaerobic ribonucleoside-triphosphate reductase activating protein [Clostridia bacterium]
MTIHGIAKMTLLDFPGHVACTLFRPGCDFRCPFCHNFDLASGKSEEVMSEEELLTFLKGRRGLLDGVAITGGEPLLHRDLPDLLSKIRGLGYLTKIDTNGYHPEALAGIISSGLCDYVAMDVKNSPSKYAETCGVASVDLSRIEKSIGILKGASVDSEFRTTVTAELHTADDIEEIGKMIAGAKKYFLQAFVDRDTVPFEGFSAPPHETMTEYLGIARKYVPEAALRGID